MDYTNINSSVLSLVIVSLLTFFGYFVIRNTNEERDDQIIVSKKDYTLAIQLASTNKKLEERLSNIRQPIAEIQKDIRNLCERIDEIYSKLNVEVEDISDTESESISESESDSEREDISGSGTESESESEHEIKESVHVNEEIEVPKNIIFLRSMNRVGTLEST
jgi:hypothetical protein